MKSDMQKIVEAINFLGEKLKNLSEFTSKNFTSTKETIEKVSKVVEFNKEYALISYGMILQSLSIIMNYDKELKETFIRITGELLSDKNHPQKMEKALQLMNDIATCDTLKPQWIPEIIDGGKKEEID